MGRMYSAAFDAVAVTAAQDLFEVVAPSDACVVIHAIVVGQDTDAGDAQDEQLRIRLIRGHATSGSGGSSPTVAPLEFGDPAFGGTVEANNTTVASTGTPVTMHSEPFNVRAGFVYRPTPEERITLSPSQRLVVNLPGAPADSLTMSGTIVFEEIGG